MDMWMMDGIIELVAVSTMCPKEKKAGGVGANLSQDKSLYMTTETSNYYIHLQ